MTYHFTHECAESWSKNSNFHFDFNVVLALASFHSRFVRMAKWIWILNKIVFRLFTTCYFSICFAFAFCLHRIYCSFCVALGSKNKCWVDCMRSYKMHSVDLLCKRTGSARGSASFTKAARLQAIQIDKKIYIRWEYVLCVVRLASVNGRIPYARPLFRYIVAAILWPRSHLPWIGCYASMLPLRRLPDYWFSHSSL